MIQLCLITTVGLLPLRFLGKQACDQLEQAARKRKIWINKSTTLVRGHENLTIDNSFRSSRSFLALRSRRSHQWLSG